jgi:hypothetical protein
MKLREWIDKLVCIWAMTGLLANTSVFIAIFLVAYAEPTKTLTIGIDSFGEAGFELVAVGSFIPAIIHLLAKLLYLTKGWFND